jgi:hypothetical protein
MAPGATLRVQLEADYQDGDPDSDEDDEKGHYFTCPAAVFFMRSIKCLDAALLPAFLAAE